MTDFLHTSILNKNRYIWLFALLIMSLIISCDKDKDQSDDGDDSPPGIYGQVVDANGQPLEGVEIHLIAAQGVEINGVEVTVPDSLCELQGE